MEADVVAHCGSHLDGRFLSTLTLTDIATGWTECLPLRTKSAEAVVSALQQARTFFPFLGVDTDSGCEFINERLLASCDAQQITFTRGREGVKNDQNFVEQKNGAVVRLSPPARPATGAPGRHNQRLFKGRRDHFGNGPPVLHRAVLGSVGPISSKTEEGELQKQSFHVFVPDPVPSSQPEQNANGCAHALHQKEACPSP